MSQEATPPPGAPQKECRCHICGGALVEKRLKYFCTQCGVLCQTCCDAEIFAK